MTRKKKTERQKAEIRYRKHVFNDLLTIWLNAETDPDEPKRTLASFGAKLIPPRTQGEISRWRSEKEKYDAYKIEDDDLDSICDVLGIKDKSIFYLDKKSEYEYDPDAINKYIEEKYGFLIDNENVDSYIKLMQFIKANPDLEKRFPLWTKIRTIRSQADSIKKEIKGMKKDDFERLDYEHMLESDGYMRALYNTLPNAAPSQYAAFQINTITDGTKTLQYEDVMFLLDIQFKIINYIKQLFDDHRKELKEEAKRAESMITFKAMKDGKVKLNKPFDVEFEELTDEEMILLDPYYKDYYFHKMSKQLFEDHISQIKQKVENEKKGDDGNGEH